MGNSLQIGHIDVNKGYFKIFKRKLISYLFNIEFEDGFIILSYKFEVLIKSKYFF